MATASETQAALEEVRRLKEQVASLSQPASKSNATPAKIFATPKTAEDQRYEKTFGFNRFSEFTKAVYVAGGKGRGIEGEIDKRLYAPEYVKAVSGMSEGQGADGGFLIPPEFSNSIFERVYSNDLISRTDRYTCTGNTMSFPAVDESSRADGSRQGGVRAYWVDEAQQGTKSAPKFRRVNLVLKKLMALGYVTDELLSDSSVAMDQYLTRKFAQEIEFAIGNAIVNGTGAGMPLGILATGFKPVVSVAKDTGQATGTITFSNIQNMWARLWARSQTNAVWLVNQDTSPQLNALSLGIGAAGVAAYLPPGGLSGSPYATILGRPVITTEFNASLSTVGDIILADLSQYITLSKGSVDSQMSMHLRFDFDEMAFRVLFRVDGAPWWQDVLTPYKGTNTQAPFITLATR